MERNLRIMLSSLIGLIGVISTYLLFDLMYRLAFMDLGINNFFDSEGIRMTLILSVITLSTTPSLKFHFRKIKTLDNKRRSSNISPKEKLSSRIYSFGNALFGLSAILLGTQILKVTINYQLSDYHEVLYHNYPISLIIILVGITILIDAIKNNKTECKCQVTKH